MCSDQVFKYLSFVNRCVCNYMKVSFTTISNNPLFNQPVIGQSWVNYLVEGWVTSNFYEEAEINLYCIKPISEMWTVAQKLCVERECTTQRAKKGICGWRIKHVISVSFFPKASVLKWLGPMPPSDSMYLIVASVGEKTWSRPRIDRLKLHVKPLWFAPNSHGIERLKERKIRWTGDHKERWVWEVCVCVCVSTKDDRGSGESKTMMESKNRAREKSVFLQPFCPPVLLGNLLALPSTSIIVTASEECHTQVCCVCSGQPPDLRPVMNEGAWVMHVVFPGGWRKDGLHHPFFLEVRLFLQSSEHG